MAFTQDGCHMIPLSLANILHHKLRSALSALGVAIAICMLITLAGLSRGSLEEVADRWDAIHADLIVYPSYWGQNITTASGGGLPDGEIEKLRQLTVGGAPAVEDVVPVFISRFRIGKQEHNIVGVRPRDLPMLTGGREIRPGGRAFDPDARFGQWLRQRLADARDEVVDIAPDELARHGGLEMVIDSRLARAAGLRVGDEIDAVGHRFRVVGIVPQGAMARGFMPLETAQWLFHGALGRSTLAFVRLKPGVNVGAAVEAIRRGQRLSAAPVAEYRAMLQSQIGSVMYQYVDMVNAILLVVALLFVLVVLYTMVLQRTREIAVLRSMGATRAFVLRQVLWESLVLTGAGAAAGVALSFLAGWAIQWFAPFLTVKVPWLYVPLAAAVALAGALLAGLYPAYRAMRVDMVEALTLE